jgi:hypothetical protein
MKRRMATDELAALPPPELLNGTIPVPGVAKAAR